MDKKIKRYVSFGLVLVGVILFIAIQIINYYEIYDWQSIMTKIVQGYLIIVIVYVVVLFLILVYNFFKKQRNTD